MDDLNAYDVNISLSSRPELVFPDDLTVIGGGPKEIIIQKRMLGSSTIYRPESHVHYSISASVLSNINTLPQPTPTPKEHNRNAIIATFKLKIPPPINIGEQPMWSLQLCTITGNDDDDEPFIRRSCRLTCSWKYIKWIRSQQQLNIDLKSNTNTQTHTHTHCITLEIFAKQILRNARLIAEIINIPVDESTPYYFPNFIGDVVSGARQHYDRKKVGLASDSKLEKLRKYNNEVKRELINLVTTPQTSVLDLACGHGQDLLKYSDKNLFRYLGIDISSQEIKEANRRLMSLRQTRQLECEASFTVGDLTLSRTYTSLPGYIHNDSKYGIVSIQFAMHYLMNTYDAASKFLNNVSILLRSNGWFIGTIADSTVIADRLKKLNIVTATDGQDKGKFGNDLYSVTFDSKYLRKVLDIEDDSLSARTKAGIILNENKTVSSKYYDLLNNEWGIPYEFYLVDHIDNAVEFVVPWTSFVTLAYNHGLVLQYHMRFDEFLERRLEGNSRLIEFGNRLPMTCAEEQFEVFSFYKIFAFRKISEEKIVKIPRKKHIYNVYNDSNIQNNSHIYSHTDTHGLKKQKI
eukprot:GHVR01053400.1.p1 GENE.GHVR01053400.1~~GHVR01053400.1.p1  ORF type:complete len:598 (+),score=128.47 GHVR01053400.1:69-1796(+)